MSYTLENTIYPEEVYAIPPKPIVALPKPWNLVPDSEKILLEKILGLAQLSPRQVKIVTLQKLDVLQWTDRPQKVIAFGLEVPGFMKNEILDVQGIKMIVASDLAALEIADKEIKQKFTQAMKALLI